MPWSSSCSSSCFDAMLAPSKLTDLDPPRVGPTTPGDRPTGILPRGRSGSYSRNSAAPGGTAEERQVARNPEGQAAAGRRGGRGPGATGRAGPEATWAAGSWEVSGG